MTTSVASGQPKKKKHTLIPVIKQKHIERTFLIVCKLYLLSVVTRETRAVYLLLWLLGLQKCLGKASETFP